MCSLLVLAHKCILSNVVPDVMDRRDDELVKKDDPRRSRRREFCEGQGRQDSLCFLEEGVGRGQLPLPLPAEAKNCAKFIRGAGWVYTGTAQYGHLIVENAETDAFAFSFSLRPRSRVSPGRGAGWFPGRSRLARGPWRSRGERRSSGRSLPNEGGQVPNPARLG